MSLLTSLLSGSTAMGTASAGVSATSADVANATTPGYTRRVLKSSTAEAVRRGSAWIGTGVRVDGVVRVADNLLTVRRIGAAGASVMSSTERDALSRIETALDSSDGAGVRTAWDAFFQSMERATSDPSELGARRAVVVAGQTLARTVTNAASTIDEARTDAQDSAAAKIDDVNETLAQLAAINTALTSANDPPEAGDLLDKRDVLVGELAESLGVSASFAADGTATVLLGGHAIVSGSVARTLQFDTTGATPRVLVSADKGWLDATKVTGGAVGGEMQAVARLDGWLTDLDTFATTFTSAINAAHASGFTSAGVGGGSLFSVSGTHPSKTLAFDPTVASNPQFLALATSPAGYPGDGGNLVNLIAVRDAALSGGLSGGELLSAVTARAGADVSVARNNALVDQARRDDLDNLATNLSSVDLDEAATRLVEYQAAWQAAAKVIKVTNDLLGDLMGIV